MYKSMITWLNSLCTSRLAVCMLRTLSGATQKSEASKAKGAFLDVLLDEGQRGPELVHALTERSEHGLTVLGQCVAWGFQATVNRLLAAIK